MSTPPLDAGPLEGLLAGHTGPESLMDEVKRYVGFAAADEEALRALRPGIEPHVEALLEDFYSVIDRHAGARAVFTDPAVQRPRLRQTLAGWIRSVFEGPWDEVYVASRVAIGHAHVRQRMPQHYMPAAMAVVRRWSQRVIFEVLPDERRLEALTAVDKVLDIDLALMLSSYRDDLLGRMQRQERLATIGELGASIHHELKNPLAAVGLAAFALGERRSVRADRQARELLERIEQNTQRCSRIINDMLSYTRLQQPAFAAESVEQLVRAAVGRVVLPGGLELTIDLDPALPAVWVDGAQVEQILVNLLTNAVQACGRDGHVGVVGRPLDGAVRMQVVDDGVGLAEEHQHRVFEPLFTTKPDGVGLGLSLSRHLAQANRGTLELGPRPEGGAVATLVLPATGR